MTYNARYKTIADGIPAERIATRIELQYVPNGITTPEQLTATWWAQDFAQLGGGYHRIGEDGDRMTTVLADHATTVLSVADPVTEQTVELSATGAVKWLMKYFDYQYNLETPEVLPDEEDTDGTDLPDSDDPVGV